MSKNRYAVVHYPANAGSKMVAGARLAHWLRNCLLRTKAYGAAVFLVDSTNIKQLVTTSQGFGNADVYTINVPKTMVAHVPETEKLYRTAGRLIWLQNDYDIWAPFPEMQCHSMVYCAIQERMDTHLPVWVWSTCEDRCRKYSDMYRYINWNALAYMPLASPMPYSQRTARLLYWGAARKGRAKAFAHYFISSRAFITISAPERAWSKFSDICGHDLHMIPPITVPDEVQRYAATLYIEDERSSKVYHSPANRFYEALSARTAILVDGMAVGTLRKAGFQVDDRFIVHSRGDISAAMGRPKELAAIASAQLRWHKDPVLTTLEHDVALGRRVNALVKELCK